MPELNTLMYLAIMLIGGLVFGRIVKLVKMPNVTGYLICGLILGPSVTGIIPSHILDGMEIISTIALALIAFTIGLSFKTSYFREVGATPVVIAIFEAVVAVVLVQTAVIASGADRAFAIVLGAIAAATAPAATIMVIKQYRAKGPVTSTLLSVVAIDDAVALISFGFCVTIAKVIEGGADGNIVLSVLRPFGEVLLALLIGSIVGVLMKIPLKFFKKNSNRLIILTGFVFLSCALAKTFGVSELLSCMMTGAVFCNISEYSDVMAELADSVTPPIFMLFFVVSGADLDLKVLPSIGVIGVIYVVVRVIGKWAGAYAGAKLMHAPANVCKYIGPTLIPQAGVAIGLTIVAQSVVPQYAAQIRAVILCATLIYEMIGPIVTKLTLTKAGEIKPEAQ